MESGLEGYLEDIWYLFTANLEPFYIPPWKTASPFQVMSIGRQVSSLKEAYCMNQPGLKSS